MKRRAGPLHHSRGHTRVLFEDAGDFVATVAVPEQIPRGIQPRYEKTDRLLRMLPEESATEVHGGHLHTVDEILAEEHNLPLVFRERCQGLPSSPAEMAPLVRAAGTSGK